MDSKRRRITPNEMDLCMMAGDPRWELDMTEETQCLVYVGPEPKDNEIEDLYVPLEHMPTETQQAEGPQTNVPVDGGHGVAGPPTLVQHLLERLRALGEPSSRSSTTQAVEAKEPEANANDSPVQQ